MTREEFAIIVKGMRAVYAQPTFIADKDAFDVWYELFGRYPYDAVSAAAKAHMVSSPKIPTPADINIQLMKLKAGNSSSLPSVEESWAMVRKAVRNANYHAEEEFEKLPEIVQKAIGTHQNLAAWAMMEIDAFETVQKSHFIRLYNGLVERERSEERLPRNIRSVIESARTNNAVEQYNRQRLEAADSQREAVNRAWEYATTPALIDTDNNADPTEYERELMLRFGREEQGE